MVESGTIRLLMFEIGIILILILFNALLAMAEAGVVAARKVRIEADAKAGVRGAKAAYKTVQSPIRALSTIQFGITIIAVFSGVFGGATIAEDLAAIFADISWLAPIAQPLSLGVVVVSITYFTLVVGEIVPKRLGMEHPEAVLKLLAGPMIVISRIASPIVSLLTFSTALILKPLGVGTSRKESVSEEEIRSVIRMGAANGVLEAEEGAVIERIFSLADRKTGSFMIPRRDVQCLSPDADESDIARFVSQSTTTELPVSPGGLDEIVGVVSVLDLAQHGKAALKQRLKQPLFIPETTKAFQAIELFHQAHAQIACVTDELGTIDGLLRLTDLLEDVLGEIDTPDHGQSDSPDESDEPVRIQDDGSLVIDSLLPIAEFLEEVDPHAQDLFDQSLYHTLSGMMIHKLGRVARDGDVVDIGPWRFEVLSMDNKRIKLLRAKRLEQET